MFINLHLLTKENFFVLKRACNRFTKFHQFYFFAVTTLQLTIDCKSCFCDFFSRNTDRRNAVEHFFQKYNNWLFVNDASVHQNVWSVLRKTIDMLFYSSRNNTSKLLVYWRLSCSLLQEIINCKYLNFKYLLIFARTTIKS